MRARISVGFFVVGLLLLTMDPLAGQPGGGKDGKRSFQFQPPGGSGYGQPGSTPMAPGAPPQQGERTRTFQFQPGGGQPGGFQPGGGGGFGRGGGGMDPDTQWQMMVRMTGGTDSVDWSRVPPETRVMLKGMSERMGTQPIPDSGVWNKAQFVDFATRNQELARAKMAGAQPGAAPGGFTPPGGQPTYGQPGFGQMQPGQFGGPGTGGPGGGGKGLSDEDAMRSFRERDRDQDGRLTKEEASDRTRQNWESIDTNRDNVIDFEEYRVYIAVRFGPNAQQNQPQFGTQPGFGQPQFGTDYRGTGEGGGFGGPGSGRREEKKDDFTNVAIRFGKLPPGLPDWFAEYDTDKDGQINMFEWRSVGGKSIAEFREKDANDDGFIAPLELIRVESTNAEFDRLMVIQAGETPPAAGSRGKGGSMSGAGGKGGFPSLGGGAPTTGKGGAPSDPRSAREEKRDERVGEKMDRGKNNPFANGGKK